MNTIEIPFLMDKGILWQKEDSYGRATMRFMKSLTGGMMVDRRELGRDERQGGDKDLV
jgi:hypothetical protein